MTKNDSGLKPLILRAQRAIVCHLGLKARCYSMPFVIILRALSLVSLRTLGSLRSLGTRAQIKAPLRLIKAPTQFVVRVVHKAPPHLCLEGRRCNARQKCRRWAVLSVLLIVGTFC